MKKELAIVIPAYKATFLTATLDSIAVQTCKDFTLYIGDDCSPHNLSDIICQYQSRIDIVYKRFCSNVGGKDLVSQWERCIALTQNEPWIWLFSDDDIMEAECVENFYQTLQNTAGRYPLYHFDVKKIDEKGNIISFPRRYERVVNSFRYYKGKLLGRYMSLVVENIFSREVYSKCGGFKNFDLAWGSDTATWALFSEKLGMYTIPSGFVLWRASSENISPNLSPEIVERKAKALCDFFEWSYGYFKANRLQCLYVNVRAFISRMSQFKYGLTEESLNDAVRLFCSSHNIRFFKPILKTIIEKKG